MKNGIRFYFKPLFLCGIFILLSSNLMLKAQDTIQEKKRTIDAYPSFVGGQEALKKYINDNLKYPPEAEKDSIEGRVIVHFMIGKSGEISEVEIRKSIDPRFDAEALRVVNSMPAWIPATQDGEPVAVYFTLPIMFKILPKATDNNESKTTK